MEAAATMARNHVNRLPVLDNDSLVGIISGAGHSRLVHAFGLGARRGHS